MRHSASGVVVAVNGVTPGPASGITYDVKVNLVSGSTSLFAGVVPWRPRWPESQVQTVACPVGTPIDVLQFGTDYYFDIPELPWVTPCQ